MTNERTPKILIVGAGVLVGFVHALIPLGQSIIDGVNKLSEMSKYLICHFATNVGDANSKIQRMSIAETIL